MAEISALADSDGTYQLNRSLSDGSSNQRIMIVIGYKDTSK